MELLEEGLKITRAQVGRAGGLRSVVKGVVGMLICTCQERKKERNLSCLNAPQPMHGWVLSIAMNCTHMLKPVANLLANLM